MGREQDGDLARLSALWYNRGMSDELRVKLETELECWGMFLVDRGYQLGKTTDVGSLLPDWIDVLAYSVHEVDSRISVAPFVRVLLEYWDCEMRDEVRHVLEKGWTKDLVPDRLVPEYAEHGRGSLDESWVANLMVEYKWQCDLVDRMLDAAARMTLPG